MKHMRRFNESEGHEYLDDASHIHDSLLYDNGLHADLEAYRDIKGSLTVSVGELPQEAQELIGDIDSTIERISGEMREKIIRLYNILADDNLSDVDVQGPEDE